MARHRVPSRAGRERRVTEGWLRPVLLQAGVLDAGTPDVLRMRVATEPMNLLEAIASRSAAAVGRSGRGARGEPPAAVGRWAGRELARGASLVVGWPGRRHEVIESVVGPRLWLVPAGLAWERPTVGLLSSRLGRRLARHTWLWDAVADVRGYLERSGGQLLLVRGTALYRAARYLASTLDGPSLHVTLASDGCEARRDSSAGSSLQAIEAWLARLAKARASPEDDSPLLQGSPPIAATCAADLLSTPACDRLVAAAADRVLAFHVRHAGSTRQLLAWRAGRRDLGAPPLVLAGCGSRAERSVVRQLVRRGARPMYRLGVPARQRTSGGGTAEQLSIVWPPPACAAEAVISRCRPPILHAPPESAFPYLVHWTREPSGPWPDESEEAYWRRLLYGPPALGCPLDTLVRIAETRRLIASAGMVRGPTAVVSFAAIGLTRLAQKRRFQGHLNRWDAEPYGVGICQAWLAAQGARPVVYGDEATYERLETSQRCFFQKRYTRSASGAWIDWSEECEWRHVGDVILDHVDRRRIFAFVPTVEEGRLLQRVCPWPIVVVP